MDSQKLEIYANEFLKKNFDISLEIPLRVSKRMKSRLGAFQIKYRGNNVLSSEIVISYNFISHNQRDTILDVLYHECVHYALYTLGEPYKDSDRTFLNTLKRLGISRTRTYTYKGQSHLYECGRCKYQFSKNVKGYEKRYICRKCRGEFKYKGVVIQEQ